MWKCIKCETLNKENKCIVCSEARPAPVHGSGNMRNPHSFPPPPPLNTEKYRPREPHMRGHPPLEPHMRGHPPPKAHMGGHPPPKAEVPSAGEGMKNSTLALIFGTLVIAIFILSIVVINILQDNSDAGSTPNENGESAHVSEENENGNTEEPEVEEEELDEEPDEEEWVVVPSLTGLTEADAILAIEEEGLEIGDIKGEYNDIVLEGRVMSQSLPPGQQAELGTAIDIAISLGAPTSGPFNLTIWGGSSTVQIELEDVGLRVPVPTGISDVNSNTWLQDEENYFFVDSNVNTGSFMVEVLLIGSFADISFSTVARNEIEFIVDWLDERECTISATLYWVNEIGDSALGFISIQYEDGEEIVELIKLSQYDNQLVRTRLRIKDINNHEEFFKAYGFWEFYLADYIGWGE